MRSDLAKAQGAVDDAESRMELGLLEAEDIADTVVPVVTRPRRTAVDEMLVRPTEQER